MPTLLPAPHPGGSSAFTLWARHTRPSWQTPFPRGCSWWSGRRSWASSCRCGLHCWGTLVRRGSSLMEGRGCIGEHCFVSASPAVLCNASCQGSAKLKAVQLEEHAQWRLRRARSAPCSACYAQEAGLIRPTNLDTARACEFGYQLRSSRAYGSGSTKLLSSQPCWALNPRQQTPSRQRKNGLLRSRPTDRAGRPCVAAG